MDEFTSRRTAEADWVVTRHSGGGSNYPRLHAPREWCDPDFNAYVEEGITACGFRGFLAIPGMFTRMSADRCKHCCRMTGMPEGQGSPKNGSAECKRIATKRAEPFAPNVIFADPKDFLND